MVNKFLLVIMLGSLYGTVTLQSQDCGVCHDEKTALLPKIYSLEEKAVGIMDKGQLRNLVSNFGDLSNWHTWQNDAIRWPGNASDETQYCFGLGLVVATPENVVESITGAFAGKRDWTPVDQSMGRVFSGDVTAVSDQTPFLPFSDNRLTWPEGYFDPAGNWISTPGSRQWPGWFRLDPNPVSPNFGSEIPGEFASDRDIYCVYDDSDNPEGSLGLNVRQMSYTYGRPYAEDFIFFEFYLSNNGAADLDSVYLGFYAVFRPDYDYHDYIRFVNVDKNSVPGDFVYVYDVNNRKDGAWEGDPTPMGIVGLQILDTPYNMGVTDFHFFSRDVTPDTDEKMWAIISGNRFSPLIDPSFYFHGEDPRIDDTSPDSLASYFPVDSSDMNWAGAPVNFYIMSGPFTLPVDSTVHSSIAIVMGDAGDTPFEPDTSDLMKNARMARKMWQNWFQGSGPPAPPEVKAYADDGKVTLFWSSEPSESSRDILTGEKDFEGYKIYRSTDRGKTWGNPVTDAEGNIVGYQPIAIFDIINDVSGVDPVFPQILGHNTGLKHTYVDSNLVNGIEYWYCVTSYDKGNQNPDSLEQSYQYPLGNSTMEPHTVSVVPGVKASDLHIADVPSLSPDNGVPCDGTASVKIVNPDSLTGHTYQVQFNDSLMAISASGDTSRYTGFTLIDLSEGDTLFRNHVLSDDSGDNLPVVDGFRLSLKNSPAGVETYWSLVHGDTCTFTWTTVPWGPYDPEIVYTDYSFKIVIDTLNGIWVKWYDLWLEDFPDPSAPNGTYADTLAYLPIRVYMISDDEQIDVSEHVYLGEFLSSPYGAFSLPGWDIIPGGAGYAPAFPYPDRIIMEYITAEGDTNGLRLVTQNEPDGIPPSQGDEFTIRRYNPFRPEVTYTFTIPELQRDPGDSYRKQLEKIRVVPDPYIVSNSYEYNEFGKRLKFNHLPSECTIKIYNLAGDYIDTIRHSGNEGYIFWDMKTYNDQYIAPGIYFYVVKAPDGSRKMGRFLVIK